MSVKLTDPQFEGQTKTKLGNAEIRGIVESVVSEGLNRYLEEFKKYSREEIFNKRKEKFLGIGKQKFYTAFSDKTPWIKKDNFFILLKYKKILTISILIILLGIWFLF